MRTCVKSMKGEIRYECKSMTVKQRILAIRLMEKAKEDSEYAKKLGVMVIYDGREKKKECK